MTTLETIIQKRLSEYEDKISQLPEIERRLKDHPNDTELRDQKDDLLKLQDEYISYLLQAAPFNKALDDDDTTTGEDHIARDVVESVPHGGKTQGSGGLRTIIKETQVSKRSETFAEYMQQIEGKILDMKESSTNTNKDEDTVCVCGAALYFDAPNSTLVCESCGRSKYHIEVSRRNLTYDEEVTANSNPSFTYNRLNHLCEWLNSIQAKENTEVPESVIEAVKAEFRKEGTITRRDIKPSKVRAYLKKLNLNKYYEHTNYITGLLNGVPPPKFPRELEDKFKTMFLAIQAPFERHCPPGRKNFLSYSYTLYKFCELLGEKQYMKHFTLLKSPSKLHAQDMIWKGICSDLNWDYIPSV